MNDSRKHQTAGSGPGLRRWLFLSPCLLFSLSPLLSPAQTVGQWELRKRGATGMTSYGLTAENGKVIGFTAGVPAMITIGAGTGDLIAANNLSELTATAATARTNLGLGALSTLAEVASAQITDGTIVNADISASAAIAYTKMEAGSIFIYSTGGVMTKYSTLSAAKAAASSGQTIYVGPGTYAVTESLLKDGVNWHFAAGATVTRSTAEFGIWDDGGSSMTSVVTGEGVFAVTTSGNAYVPCVHVSHASSSLTIHARSISATQSLGGGGTPIAVWGTSTLKVVCSESIWAEDQDVTNFGTAVYWDDGDMFVRCPHIYADNVAVWPHSKVGSSGDFFVDADIIEGTATDGADNPGVIFDYGENASAASWITARIVKSAGNTIAAVCNARDSKLYVTAQKIFGRVENMDFGIGATTGLTYVEADKIEGVGNGGADTPSMAFCEYGTLRITCRHWSPVSYTGETIKVTGGTAYIRGGDYTGGASAKGIEVTGGTAEFESMLVNTSANSGTNGATVSGGTAVFRDVRWTSHASGKDIAQSGGTATVNGGYGTGTGGVLTTSGTVGIVKNSLTALTTDTTGNYVADVAGTSNEITSTHTPGEGSTATLSLPATIDLGGKTSFEIPNGAAPTVDAFGEIAGDNDLWAASRGAPIFFDGTAATALVNVLVSDAPSNGQVPKWNTGGTITWEADNSGGTISGTDTQVMFFDGTDTPAGDAGMTYNKTTNVLTATGFVGALTGNASTATTLATSRTINGVSFDGSANVADYATDSAGSDTYAITLSPVPGSYITNAHYRFIAGTANTGACTININSLGAKTIKKAAGGITTDLADNDIRSGQAVDLVYDGTNMQMQSTLGNAAAGGSGGNWVLVSTTTISGSPSTVDLALSGSYLKYMIQLDSVVASGDYNMYLRTSTDGGSTYDSGASDYNYAWGVMGGYSPTQATTSFVSFGPITGTASDEGITGDVIINDPSSSTKKTSMTWAVHAPSYDTASYNYYLGAARRNSAADVDHVRLYFSSGTMASGTIKLYRWSE